MDSELRATTIDAVRAMRDLLKLGSIPVEIYYKGIVALAYEFALGGETGWTTKLLLEVPLTYYKENQIQQCMDDPTFAECCLELSRLLVLYGMVDAGPIINQGPGEA